MTDPDPKVHQRNFVLRMVVAGVFVVVGIGLVAFNHLIGLGLTIGGALIVVIAYTNRAPREKAVPPPARDAPKD